MCQLFKDEIKHKFSISHSQKYIEMKQYIQNIFKHIDKTYLEKDNKIRYKNYLIYYDSINHIFAIRTTSNAGVISYVKFRVTPLA